VSDLVVADGVIYINAAWRGLLYALNATDHTKMWTYRFGIWNTGAPPVVVNNVVYLQTGRVFFYRETMQKRLALRDKFCFFIFLTD